jgi:putative ABC transport system ATP-binding protein
MIHTKNIQKYYRRGEHERHVLQNVNIDIEEGEYVVISGPSGSGKTTLLSILGLVDLPSGGDIIFRGTKVTHLPERQRNRIRRDHISYVFENIHLVEELNIFENIELPLLYLSNARKERKHRVEELLERFRLTHLKYRYPHELGLLLQQKVALARAYSFHPSVIIADEPVGRLSSSEVEEFMEMFRKLNEEGQTIIMATHSAEIAQRGQRNIRLFDGHIVSTPKERS